MNIGTMRGDRLTILDRLERRASTGSTSANLRLYPNQEKKLGDAGFSVTRIRKVAEYPGQYLCHIDWRNATCGEAYELFQMALSKNPALSKICKT